jgi:glutamate racemase
VDRIEVPGDAGGTSDGETLSTGSRPIGVFDSGVGGLSVLREIRRELPNEDVVYVADSGNAPYGEQSKEFIERRAAAILDFFIEQHAKAVVVACNTATGMAVDALRSQFSLPIVAIEPAVKPAVSLTKSGVVGVLATTQTLASERFSRLLEKYGDGVEVVAQPCPGLAEQVEKGELSGPVTKALVERYVRPMIDKGADTIVLGCTHYPFVSDVIRSVAGPHVTLIDPAVAVARELRRRLEAADVLSHEKREGREAFWTSGAAEDVQPVIAQLWNHEVDVHELPVLPRSG